MKLQLKHLWSLTKHKIKYARRPQKIYWGTAVVSASATAIFAYIAVEPANALLVSIVTFILIMLSFKFPLIQAVSGEDIEDQFK